MDQILVLTTEQDRILQEVMVTILLEATLAEATPLAVVHLLEAIAQLVEVLALGATVQAVAVVHALL